MATWSDLQSDRPDLAETGHALLYQVGVGLAFLATVRADGRPEVHPMCPLLDGTGLYAFIVPSPKRSDLRRDGWYSMHSFPCPDNEDAFYLSGRAVESDDAELRDRLSAQFVSERSQFAVPPPGPDDALFRFDFDSCLLTRTTGHGDPTPQHSVWHAPLPGRSA